MRKEHVELWSLFQMQVALRFFATGIFQREVGDLHGVDKSTGSRIIKKVASFLCAEEAQHIYFPESRSL